MKAKVFYRWIREQAKQLKPETYTAYFPEDVEIEVPGKEPITVRRKSPEEMPVNHYRRAKRLFKRYGFREMDIYFRKRGLRMLPVKNIYNGKQENSKTESETN